MADIHECPRCGYETSYTCNFIKHLLRINICKSIKSNNDLISLKQEWLPNEFPHVCENCPMKFTTKYGLTKHNKKCTKKDNNMSIEIENMKKQIAELQQLVNNNSASTSTIQIPNIQQNNNIQIQNIQNNNITIVLPVTLSNDSFITKEFMQECFRKKIDGLTEFLIKKHFNPKYPENHNIKCDEDGISTLEETCYKTIFTDNKTVVSTKIEDKKMWIKYKKETASKDRIASIVLDAMSNYIKQNDIEEEDADEILRDFVKYVAIPMDYTFGFEELSEINAYPGDNNPIQLEINNKLLRCVEQYTKRI
jgi:hypothetical protein